MGTGVGGGGMTSGGGGVGGGAGNLGSLSPINLGSIFHIFFCPYTFCKI
jgi:hypothetical protein